MRFKNRQHAGELLLERLSKYRNTQPLVLAVPRGAVPMAALIAKNLGGDLDLILVRKIGAPFNSEYAMGAVDEEGNVLLNESARYYQIPQELMEEEIQQETDRIKKQRMLYTSGRKIFEVKDRTIILVDDGIVTGSTLLAAIHFLKSKGAKKVIVAAPVSSLQAARKLQQACDEFICLEEPEDFQAVGQFYRDFSQVSDEEVIEIMKHSSL